MGIEACLINNNVRNVKMSISQTVDPHITRDTNVSVGAALQ